MRGLKHPTAPGVKFHLGPIKEKYVDELIRRVRTKSAPGGDVVSYKVFNYCHRLRHIIFKLLRDLSINKELIEGCCRAESMNLPKEQNAENIEQFRPISIINMTCKVFMGMLVKRTVSYLQSNSYVDKSVQKARIPGIPGCIEHASMIWDAVQELKNTKGT